MKTTPYFEKFVRVKHPEVELEWIERVLVNPVKTEVQPNGRISYIGNIAEFGGRTLRVITESDGETVHNAFFDRKFLKRQQKGQEPIE